MHFLIFENIKNVLFKIYDYTKIHQDITWLHSKLKIRELNLTTSKRK